MDSRVDIPRYPLEWFFCHSCAMVQLGYTVPKEVMFVDHQYVSGTTRSLRNHFHEVSRRIVSRIALGPDDYVLDIGGNDGTFLSRFKDQSCGLLNVDSGKLQAGLSEAGGVPCWSAFFNQETAREILAEKGPARVIHASGILFHLEELHSAFDGIKQLLDPSGLLVAEFIYLPEMVRKTAFDQIYHEHLLYYTLHSFEGLLRRHGLAICDVELFPIHGGSCVAYISHAERAAPTKAVLDLVKAEKAARFDTAVPYRTFAKRAAHLRDELTALVRELRGAGRSIQALGAPVKGTTILNYCGLTHLDIDCAVELNSHKCQTYYPGTRIPVYHQDSVAPPDVYLLLAWNFKDEILAHLEDFRAAGGQILVPIPRPEII